MKKFIEYCNSLPCVQKEVYRNIKRKEKNYSTLKNHLEFKILEIVYGGELSDLFARFYSDCILLKMYQQDQQNNSDIVFETKRMHWQMHKNMWNWYEIPLSKINIINEHIVFELINKAYGIAHAEASSKENKALYQKINDLNFNEEQLFNMILENKNALKYKSLLKSMERKSILLLENQNKKTFKGVSKLGGSPDIPLDFKWPHYENKELTFLAQINLSEIESNQLLPKTGYLYFFALLTNNDDDYYHFMDSLDNSNIIQIFYLDVPKENLKKRINKTYHFNEVLLDTKTFNVYPETEEEPVFKNYNLNETEINVITEIADIYYESIDYKFKIKSHHNLLGYYRPTQELHPEVQTKNYITLFQMSGSNSLNLDLGDGGMLYIYIDENDLKNLDFSKIIIDSQCG